MISIDPDKLAVFGQVQQSVRDVWSGLLWIGLILLAGVIIYVVARVARRRSMSQHGLLGSNFSLDQLREMRDRGELTIAEYEALKRNTIAAITGKHLVESAANSLIERPYPDDRAVVSDKATEPRRD